MTIELRGVVKKAGAETHIHPTDLVLKEGAFNVLLGTTLSGKTTLMRLMAGLEKPSSGRILFRGEDVTGGPRAATQRVHGLPAVHQLSEPERLREHRVTAAGGEGARSELERRVAGVADLLGLTSMLGRRPGELSGGQQQRTALARALVKDSALVLLDEPLANLDYKLREELREELPRILEEKGAIIVYATSEPQEALLLGGHTATLHQGRSRSSDRHPTSTAIRRTW